MCHFNYSCSEFHAEDSCSIAHPSEGLVSINNHGLHRGATSPQAHLMSSGDPRTWPNPAESLKFSSWPHLH